MAAASPIEWLADQYFGDRTSIMLPDLVNRFSVGPGFLVEIWTASVPDGGAQYDNSVSNGEAIREYFPFVQTNGSSSRAAFHLAPIEASTLVEKKIADHEEVADLLREKRLSFIPNRLTISAVDVDALPEIRQAILKADRGAAYSNASCIVMRLARKAGDPRFINVFVGSANGRWGLHSPEQERCVLAGILEVMGMDTGWVMSRADHFYPQRISPASTSECLFAVTYHDAAAAERSKVNPSPSCVTRARAAWPYRLLWIAFQSGALKEGSMTRDQFVKALNATAELVGSDRHSEIDRKEDLAIRNAELGDAYVPPAITIIQIKP